MDTQTTGPGVPADSPPAPDFSTFEREANALDLGQKPSPTPPAESSPAPVAEGAAPAEAGRADSPPAPPDDKKPKNLQTRRDQVDAEVAALREQLRVAKALRDELAHVRQRPQPDQPVSDPARSQPKSWERYKQFPDAPKAENFDSYEDYLDARAEFIADRRFEDRARQSETERRTQEHADATTRRITGFTEKLAKARESDAAFDSKVNPYLLQEVVPAFALRPGEPVTPANVLLQEIVDSPVSAELLVYLSTPEGIEAWNAAVKADSPAATIRAFGRIEARFLSGGKAAEAPAPAKPVTSAPAPPTTLGEKPPQSPDRARAALAAGDYSAYEAAADAADLAVPRR